MHVDSGPILRHLPQGEAWGRPMSRSVLLLSCMSVAALLAGAASAEDGDRKLRLIGKGAAPEPASLVVWAGGSCGFNDTDDGPPGDMERDALGQWQAQGERPGRGLILADQLAALRADAAAAKAKARWTAVGGKGWKGGYPA